MHFPHIGVVVASVGVVIVGVRNNIHVRVVVGGVGGAVGIVGVVVAVMVGDIVITRIVVGVAAVLSCRCYYVWC